MSVIPYCPSEIKALQRAAVDLFPVEPGGPVTPQVFEALHVANLRAYAISYAGGDLSPEAVAVLRRDFAQVQPGPQTYTPHELLEALHGLEYNCQSNGGTYTLEGEEEQERRRLMQSVAFELMCEGGPAVHVAAFGNIRRVNFDLYEITTRDPRDPHGKVYLIDGSKPHPLEGFTTQRPGEAFTNLWTMHDECAAHWEVEYERDMAALAQRLDVI